MGSDTAFLDSCQLNGGVATKTTCLSGFKTCLPKAGAGAVMPVEE